MAEHEKIEPMASHEKDILERGMTAGGARPQMEAKPEATEGLQPTETPKPTKLPEGGSGISSPTEGVK
jgi:hypothetical protein